MPSQYVITCGEDVKFWDSNSFSVENQVSSPDGSSISNVSWSHDGMQLAAIPKQGQKVILTWVKTPVFSRADLKISEELTYVKFAKKSSRYLGLGCKNGSLLLWDLKFQKKKKSFSVISHKQPVSCLDFNWNDTYIASGLETGDIILYNVITGQGFPLEKNSDQLVKALRYNSMKKSLLGSINECGTVTLWDTNTKKSLHKFTSTHFAPATGLAFSPINDMLFASVGLDKKIICYDIHTKTPVQTINVDNPLTCVDFFHDGVMLGVGTLKDKVLFYDLRNNTVPFKTINAHKGPVHDLSFQVSSSNNQTASNKSDRTKAPKEHKSNKKAENEPKDQRDFTQATIRSRSNSEARQSLTNKIFSPIKGDTSSSRNNVESRESLTNKLFSPLKPADTSLGGNHELRTSLSNQFSPISLTGTEKFSLNSSINLDEFKVASTNSTNGYSDPERECRKSFTGSFSPINFNSDNSFSKTDRSHIGDGISSNSKKSNPDQPNVSGGSFKSSNMRRQPIGGGWQSPPVVVIGDRPVTAGSSENDVQAIISNNLSSSSSSSASKTNHTINDVATERETFHVIQSDINQDQLFSKISSEIECFESEVAVDELDKSIVVDCSLPTQKMNGFQNGHSEEAFQNGLSATMKKPENLEKSDADKGLKSDLGLVKLQVEAVQRQVTDIKDEIEDFKDMIHRDYLDLQWSVVKEFQTQLGEIRKALQYYSINEDLVKRIEELQEENKKLRALY